MRKDSEKQIESSWAEGALSITAVLKNDSRTVDEILLLPRAKTDERNILSLLSLAKKKHVPIRVSDEAFFESVTTGHTHGGVIARVGQRRMLTPEEVFDRAGGFVFLLCGLEDPFNFGCAVRSFYAAGAGGMILSPRNWLSAAGVTIRASAGTCEALPCAVYEDGAALCALAKEKGYRVVCASERDSVDLFESDLSRPIFLIVGGEKRGISRVFLDLCDERIRIPYGRVFRGSLTASAAAAVCAFEVLRKNMK
ncbi:MAG: RNA methyltransferase [Clostridia bacterium]|nr:RNA methyltransferase [Clostridia bacterium]